MNQWKIFNYASIGSWHLKNNMVCQDSTKVEICDDIYVGCLSDGAGSAKYSKEGSALVTNYTVKHLRELYKTKLFKKRLFLHQNENNLDIYKSFYDLLEGCHFKIKSYAFRKKIPIEQYSSTMIGFMYHPNWLITFQIGDGFLVSKDNKNVYKLHFSNELIKTGYVNETNFITSSNRKHKFKINILNYPINFLCCSSDGLEKVALIKNDLFKPFFSSIENYFKQENYFDNLSNWMDNSQSLNKRVRDDKSLILISRN